jgi:hypothetical protein
VTVADDTALVGLDDVRRITGVSALTPAPGPNPRREPSHFDSTKPPPCQAIFDQRTAFDGNWTQFASTTDAATITHGPGTANSIADIGQAVAFYPDDSTAHHTFSELATKVKACRTLHVPHYDFTLDDGDPSTLVLSTHGWTVVYRVTSTVLFTVAAIGADHPEPAARSLAQTISDRIR